MPVDLDVRHVLAGLLGLAAAWFVLAPSGPRSWAPRLWPHGVGAVVAIALVLPVLVVLMDQTRFFVERDMREVGSPAFEEPVVTEEAAIATRVALEPGDTWAYTTDGGRCTELHGYYWLAFRFAPHEPDCENPDVELFWQIDPPSDAEVVARGQSYAVVRR